MSLDSKAGATPAIHPLQFVQIEIAPLVGGEYAVTTQAIVLDEQELELLGEPLTTARVSSIDDAAAVIAAQLRDLRLPLSPAKEH